MSVRQAPGEGAVIAGRYGPQVPGIRMAEESAGFVVRVRGRLA